MALRNRVERDLLQIAQYADEPRENLEVRELKHGDVWTHKLKLVSSFILIAGINSNRVMSHILTIFNG